MSESSKTSDVVSRSVPHHFALHKHCETDTKLDACFQVFHDHILLLEMRAEYQELTVAAKAERDVERAYRKACKAVSEEIKTRRHALKEHIRQQEQDSRWIRTSH